MSGAHYLKKDLNKNLFETESNYLDIYKIFSSCSFTFGLKSNSFKNKDSEIIFFVHYDRDGLLSLLVKIYMLSLSYDKISDKISFFFTQRKPLRDLVENFIIKKDFFEKLKYVYFLDLDVDKELIKKLENKNIKVEILDDDDTKTTFKYLLDSMGNENHKKILNEFVSTLGDIIDVIMPGATLSFVIDCAKVLENKRYSDFLELARIYRKSIIKHHKELGNLILKMCDTKDDKYGIKRICSDFFDIIDFNRLEYKDLNLFKILSAVLSVSNNFEKVYSISKMFVEKTGLEKCNMLIASSDGKKIQKIKNALEENKIETKLGKNRHLGIDIYHMKLKTEIENTEKIHNILYTI